MNADYLNLNSKQMAKFGSFDHRMPDHGFIDDERDRWNAQLEVKIQSYHS